MATMPRSTEGVFLDISLPQPGILLRSLWLSLARNLPLNILEGTFGGNFKMEKEKILSWFSANKFLLSANGFSRIKKKWMVKKSKNSIDFFYSVHAQQP
jgi:hypothetical protein